MGFRDLALNNEYRSMLHDVVRDFYTPVLSESVLYRRAVGFFSSSALLSLTEGIRGLLENGGTIEVIASPKLSEEDLEAIQDGLDSKRDVVLSSLLRELSAPRGPFEEARLNLLSNLIAAGVLTIKIALLDSGREVGMFHEKLGLMYDRDGDVIAFSGSMNETANAFFQNYESIDVFASWWTDPERVENKKHAFNAMWDNFEPGINVLDFPEVPAAIIDRYKVRDGIDLSDLDVLPGPDEVESAYIAESSTIPDGLPRIPDGVVLRSYQEEALGEWERHDYRGMFDMATGTGKTFTGLAAICRLAEAIDYNLAVVIVCPYQHLVDQWVEDIELFGIHPIIGYSSSPQKDWERRLEDAIRDQRARAEGRSFGPILISGSLCPRRSSGSETTKAPMRCLRILATAASNTRSRKLYMDEAMNLLFLRLIDTIPLSFTWKMMN